MLTAFHYLTNFFPFYVFFVVGSRFCERFYFNGLQTILPLYMVNRLAYSESDASLMYHIYAMLGSVLPILAGYLADNGLGKYRCIIYLTVVYVVGSFMIFVGSAEVYDPSTTRLLTLIGLLAVALGGGVSCVTLPFGGDQLSSSTITAAQLAVFFSLTYFTDNIAILFSYYVTPILRHDYQCLGEETCFPLAFGVMAFILFMSLVLITLGSRSYTYSKTEGNTITQVTKCVTYAIRKKIGSKDVKEHWLDYADDKYGGTIISDTKTALQILILFLPVPVFWALDDQMGSSWKFQAMQMDGSMGRFTIKPDQLQVIDPILTLILVPIFDVIIYPRLIRYQIMKRPLDRLCIGGFLMAVSFLMAAVLQLQIQATLPTMPTPGSAQLRVFNGLECDVTFKFSDRAHHGKIHPLDALELSEVEVLVNSTAEFEILYLTEPDCIFPNRSFSGTVKLQELQSSSVYIHTHNGEMMASQVPGFDEINKVHLENPRLRIFYCLSPFKRNLTLTNAEWRATFALREDGFSTPLMSIPRTGSFDAFLGNMGIAADIKMGPAGIYTLVIYSHGHLSVGRLITVTPPNSVHMLWQLPQYIVLTMAEVLFIITGLNLSYSMAPDSMKSLISAAWMLTDALGNIIIICVFYGEFFKNRVMEYLFFSGLMFGATSVFILFSRQPQYQMDYSNL